MEKKFAFITATNNREQLQKNLLASAIFSGSHPHRLIFREGFASAAGAYNTAIKECDEDILIFTHQDMYFPPGWDTVLREQITLLEEQDPDWGVLGAYGVTCDGSARGYVYCHGQQRILGQKQGPCRVRTLDEILLIIKKSSGLRFTPTLPGFHMYGADICLQAEKSGRLNYALSNLCLHNTLKISFLPRGYMTALNFIRKHYKDQLPLRTPCLNVHQNLLKVYWGKWRNDLGAWKRGWHRLQPARLEDPARFFKEELSSRR